MIPSHTVRIWIAGNYDDALRCVKQFCANEGACFAVMPVDYVYTGGHEAGVCVSLINYPRFPSSPEELDNKARRMAADLCAALFQTSYTIEGPEFTEWVSHREADK